MPPKVTDTRSNAAESLHAVETATADAARRIVATYSEDFLDFATLACMLGVEPQGLSYRKIAAEFAEPEPAPAKKKASKKATKKATKKASKNTTNKASKATKKTTKKTTKRTTKKTTKKAE